MERGLAINRQPVQILTPDLQITGTLELIGNPLLFLNDQSRIDVVMRDVRAMPLRPSGPFKTLSQSQVTIRRKDLMLVYFSDPDTRNSIRLLTREEEAVIYTATAIVRATFHLPAEAPDATFLGEVSGDMVPLTNVQAFWLASLPMPFPDQCELLMLGKNHVQMYHPV